MSRSCVNVLWIYFFSDHMLNFMIPMQHSAMFLEGIDF
jgi:hypothetical protein